MRLWLLAGFILVACDYSIDNHQYAQEQAAQDAQAKEAQASQINLVKKQARKAERQQLAVESQTAKKKPFTYQAQTHQITGSLLIQRRFQDQATQKDEMGFLLLVSEQIQQRIRLSLYDLNITGNPFTPESLKGKTLQELVPLSQQENASTIFVQSYHQTDGTLDKNAGYMIPPAWFDPAEPLTNYQMVAQDYQTMPTHIRTIFQLFNPGGQKDRFTTQLVAGATYPEKMRPYNGNKIAVLELTADQHLFYFHPDIPIANIQSIHTPDDHLFSVLKGSTSTAHLLSPQSPPETPTGASPQQTTAPEISSSLSEDMPPTETSNPVLVSDNIGSGSQPANSQNTEETTPNSESASNDPVISPPSTTDQQPNNTIDETPTQQNANSNNSETTADNAEFGGDDFEDWADL